MSHEIRTPMNAIIGMTDLALMSSDEEERYNYLSIVKDSGHHLLQVINDILDFSKIESGKLLLEESDFNFKNIFYSIENIYQFEIKKRGLSLILDLANDLPARIVSDELRLRQILINLISNSLKFTKKGNIKIKASLANDIKVNPGYSAIEIAISDTGCGIPLEKQELIFSKFTQLERSTSRKYGGTGLGLSIVKELVQLMQGNIFVKSEPNKGSEFVFKIVVKNGETQAEMLQEKKSRDMAVAERKPLKILLAEDDNTNIFLEQTVLRKLGNTVTVARNGIEVLSCLKKNHFDLVFMDIEMPEMDGFETAQRIRGGDCGKNKNDIWIIAMTAHALTDIKQKALEMGINDFITKPIDITKIQERIDILSLKAREQDSKETKLIPEIKKR